MSFLRISPWVVMGIRLGVRCDWWGASNAGVCVGAVVENERQWYSSVDIYGMSQKMGLLFTWAPCQPRATAQDHKGSALAPTLHGNKINELNLLKHPQIRSTLTRTLSYFPFNTPQQTIRQSCKYLCVPGPIKIYLWNAYPLPPLGLRFPEYRKIINL